MNELEQRSLLSFARFQIETFEDRYGHVTWLLPCVQNFKVNIQSQSTKRINPELASSKAFRTATSILERRSESFGDFCAQKIKSWSEQNSKKWSPHRPVKSSEVWFQQRQALQINHRALQQEWPGAEEGVLVNQKLKFASTHLFIGSHFEMKFRTPFFLKLWENVCLRRKEKYTNAIKLNQIELWGSQL